MFSHTVAMYLRKNRVREKTYWSLVETYRTPLGPRQRVVSYLGDLDEPLREGLLSHADVLLTTKTGGKIRRRCITQPSKDQATLLKRLGIVLPKQLKITQM